MVKKHSTQKHSGVSWSSDWLVRVRIRFERQGHTVLEEPIADVLMALDRTKSISGAARSLGISYRHAWLLIHEANQNSGQPLVETAIGGNRGGGAGLTDHGRAAITMFHRVQQQARAAAAIALHQSVALATGATTTLHVAAAISLQEVIALVLAEYALVRPTVAVKTIFGASNELADQIAVGGPADLFISANSSHTGALAKAGVIDNRSRCTLASNGLVVVGDRALLGKVRKPADLRRFCNEPIVIADTACPLGACTTEFLKTAGLWDELFGQMQFVENSRAVVTCMRTNRARLGIMFGSDTANAVGVTTLFPIPLSQASTSYEGAAIAASSVLGETKEFLKFLRSKTAQGCFRRCGFSV